MAFVTAVACGGALVGQASSFRTLSRSQSSSLCLLPLLRVLPLLLLGFPVSFYVSLPPASIALLVRPPHSSLCSLPALRAPSCARPQSCCTRLTACGVGVAVVVGSARLCWDFAATVCAVRLLLPLLLLLPSLLRAG